MAAATPKKFWLKGGGISGDELQHMSQITANGKPVEAVLPCTPEQFLVTQKLLPHTTIEAALAAGGAEA
jgi:hypothetical protein